MDDRPLQTAPELPALPVDAGLAEAIPDEAPEMDSRTHSHEPADAVSASAESTSDAITGASADGPNRPTDRIPTKLPAIDSDGDVLSIAQLALDEVGAMLSSAAQSAQETAQALADAGSSHPSAPSVDAMLSELFGNDAATPPPAREPATALETSTESPRESPALGSPELGDMGDMGDMADMGDTSQPADATAPADLDAADRAATAMETSAAADASTGIVTGPAACGGTSDPIGAAPGGAAEPTRHASPAVERHAVSRGGPLHGAVHAIEGLALAPLRAIAQPMGKLPPLARTVVGVFGLTLLAWAPAFWWLGADLVARDRVRPLTDTELVALTDSIHARSAASASSGGSSHGGKAESSSGDSHGKKADKPAKGASGGHH